jgi:hypothetical protein
LAFYGLLGWYALTGDLLTRSSSLAGQAVVALATFNLAVGYIAATMLGLTSGLRRYGVGLACGALLTPLYWALIAVVALRAGWQVFRRPYDWEKTSHRARRPNWSPPGQAHVRQAHVIAVPADEKPTRSTLEPDHALPTYDGSRPRSRHRSGLLLQQAGAG